MTNNQCALRIIAACSACSADSRIALPFRCGLHDTSRYVQRLAKWAVITVSIPPALPEKKILPCQVPHSAHIGASQVKIPRALKR